MKALIDGHRYELNCLDTPETQILQFVDRGHGRDTGGTTNQEVLRALISRVSYLECEVPWDLNREVLRCLRRALLLHEMRHLERCQEKGTVVIEDLPCNPENGHLKI